MNAKIILINEKKEILLLHREDKPGIGSPNKWSFVGGVVEIGEAPEEAIVRETKEEIGYDVKELLLFRVYNDPEIQRYVYIGKIDKKLSELRLTEGDNMGFFTIKNALKMTLSKNTRRYIQDYFYQQKFKN